MPRLGKLAVRPGWVGEAAAQKQDRRLDELAG